MGVPFCSGKDVCGFCKGDIAAAAERAELKSLTVSAIDDNTGLPKTITGSQV
jgi:filamentous hemagglutinin